MLRSRRDLAAELRRTSEQIAAERDARAQLAVADQRSRIATELQALVAADVSEMIVHTQNAQWMLQDHPAEADTAMAQVEVTGRHALAEMRRILGVLRHPDQEAELTPQPGIGQIPALIEQARQSRRPISLTVTGDPGPVPASVDLAVYRITEDALNGVSGDDTPVGLALSYTRAHVELCITARVRDDTAWPTASMRDRVALSQGDVDLDTVAGDRSRLIVTLPRVFEAAHT
jgi:signal transduction histidine kinase